MSTFALVDGCHIVLNSDGSGRTILFADVTCDTSHLTIAVNRFTHILGLADNNLFCAVRNKVDKVMRTDLDTFAAGLAGVLINYSHAVHNVDGIKLTYLYAASSA